MYDSIPAGGWEVQSAGDVLSACQSSMDTAAAVPCITVGVAVDCGPKMQAIAQAQNYCIGIGEEWNMQNEVQTAMKKQAREEAWDQMKDKAREVLAVSFRNSLSAFSRQIAHDTAVWVASGGKGQKPLFITEGWGEYLKNAADSALGDFIDNIGQQYGVNLCEPNINVRLAIETGIDWRQPQKVRCSFSQMMNNWESAINNANFSFEYTNSMRPGENDVSAFLMLQSGAFQTVAAEVKIKEKEGDTNSLFTDVKTFAGKILTPGTVVADAFREAVKPTGKNASFGMETFTGTIADIIEEFLNTLVSQLLTNLQNGLFSSSGGEGDNQPFQLPDLSALFNPSASPRTYEGAAGATERFRSLVDAKVKVGGPYDILTKLMLCTEQNKNNLGPTDCVIDPVLAEAIRQKTQVKDLPAEILDRPFAPQISDVANPQVAFTERNIKILRKYRIVPVGWEIVAEKIGPMKMSYTLRDVMKNSEFKDYFDPYWVLEVPELFCRQLGYGAHNATAGSQDGSITRDEYCADEQQCIQQNDSGNCTAYGYCTEERRLWDLGGKTCAPRYNTCETFTGRDNLQDSWLVNSLDFRYCNETNYGCRWLSALYNTVGNTWTHLSEEKVLKKCTDSNGCTIATVSLSPIIKEGHIMTTDQKVIMSKPCSASACSNANLINDGGFEGDLLVNSWDTYFNCSGGDMPITDAIAAGYVTTTGTIFHSGQKSLKIDNSAKDTCAAVRMNKGINLKGGKRYTLTGWVYGSGPVHFDLNDTNNIINNNSVTDRNCNTNWGYNCDDSNTVTSAGSWKYVRLVFTPINDGLFMPRAVIDKPGPYVAYFDDMQIQEETPSRCIYNDESHTCTFYQGECTIPYGGVMCSVSNCQIGANLLSSLNSSFETPDGAAAFRADKWNFIDSYYNLENRLYREQKQGASGYNLTGKAAGSTIPLSVKLDNVSVTPGKRYALKFKLKGDYIAQGGLSIGIYEKANDSSIGGLSFQVLPSFWQDYYFEFKAPAAATNTYVKITIPAYSQLLIYADDFELKEVDENCSNNSIWLTNGPVSEPDKEIYFNAQSQACDGSAEGCSQFIRTKAGLGSNLIINGSFDLATSGWEFLNKNASHFNYISASSNNYAKVSSNNDTYSDFKPISIMPGTYYIISFDAAQLASGNNNKARFEMFLATTTVSLLPAGAPKGIPVLITDCNQTSDNTLTLQNTPSGTAFEKKSCKFLAPKGANALRYKIFSESGEIYVDNIKLEAVNYNVDAPSDYTDYNPSVRPANQLAYLKKAPDLFNCYRASTAPYKWADKTTLWGILANQQPACQDYAPVCTQDEVGCELYRPTNGDPAVPGIVDTLDVCPAQCVGYSVYRQEETNFVSSKYRQFIADNNLKYCSVAYAGCDEFTNLDKLGEGAEAREYYVSFRACQKPGAADEATYYTWEGSDVTGYQLKIYKLKKSQLGTQPCTYITYSSGVAVCSDSNAAGTPGNAGYCTRDQMFSNPDCREFYNTTDGTISYRLLSKTISVSDDCHPYRRTQTQIDTTETQSDCTAKQGFWNGTACVYMAIPQEGRTCPASVMGCREFTGNRANNVRNLINSNFGTDSVSTSSWQDALGGTSGLQISTESSFVGGYSINNKATNLKIKHPVAIVQGRAYTLSFWAKSKSGGNFSLSQIKFSSLSGLQNSFTLISSTEGALTNSVPVITAEWKKFDLGPVFVTSSPSNDEHLEFNIPSGKQIYLDNVILKEVREDIFAIDNSWFTPVACDNKLGDPDGAKAIESGSCTAAPSTFRGTRCFTGEMLGCAAYKDRADQLNYFRSFTRLCRQEAAGCEALIDTYNYSPAEGKVFNAGDNSQITVKADELIYLVNDRQYACNAGEKGCTAYGLPIISQYEEVAGYNTVFLLNNPDIYNRTLCKFNEVWCDQYIGSASVRYFKNPHGRVCVYEVKEGNLDGNWYVAGTDEICKTTLDQTLGKGYGSLADKLQPVGVINNITGDGPNVTGYTGWVGACPASQSGCGEYLDPLPAIYTPLKLNNNTTTIKINTLYVVRGAAVIGSDPSVDPRYGSKHARIVYPDNSGANTIKRFYVSCPLNYEDCKTKESIKINFEGTDVFLTPAGVYYAFGNALDRGSCQGSADFDTGCVLFNERNAMDYASSTSWTDRISKYLSYDAYATYVKNRNIAIDPDTGNETVGTIEPTAPLSGQNDSNVLIKVKPDRTCNSWLSCTTYEKKGDSASALFSNNDKCLAIGLCDSFSEQGTCNHFVSNEPTSTYDKLRDINKTGYSYFGQNASTSYYSYELMAQQGEAANVINGNFESVFGSKAVTGISRTGEVNRAVTYLQPLGWQAGNYNCVASAKACSGGYPRARYDDKLSGEEIYLKTDARAAKEGSRSLQINGGNAAISEFAELDSNTDYIFSAWVNTSNLGGAGDAGDPARAEIQLRFYNKTGTIITGNGTAMTLLDLDGTPLADGTEDQYGSTSIVDSMTEGGWFFHKLLRVPVGLPWRQITLRFRTGATAGRMSFALLNMNPDAIANYDNTKLSGYSLWDDFQLKPVLKVNDAKLVNRTCRIYPDQSALSCKYVSGNNAYYGLYGYCLLEDPANPGQCLQWWPVDNIKGEILDDFTSYYQERAPLYYCIRKSRHIVSISGLSAGLTTSGELPDELQGVLKDTPDKQITPFSVARSARPIFRYPFIYKFNPTIIAAGVGLDNSIHFMEFTGTMFPKRFCAYRAFGLFDVGKLCFSASKILSPEDDANNDGLSVDDDCQETYDLCDTACEDQKTVCYTNCDAEERPWWCKHDTINLFYDNSCDEQKTTCDNNCENALDDCDAANEGGGIFAGIIDRFRDAIRDIINKLLKKFVILPEDYWGGFGLLGIGFPGTPFVFPIPMPWHEAMSFKDSSGGLFSALGDLADFAIGGGVTGVRIITDEDNDSSLSDPVPSIPGDILGYTTFLTAGQVYGAGTIINFTDEFKLGYCDTIVQVVNSAGQNKGWATRLTPGSTYQSADSDCVGDSSSDDIKCFYLSDYCLYKDCILNPCGVCDFCSNFVGKIDGTVIKTVKVEGLNSCAFDKDVTGAACPEYTGIISTADRKVFRGGKECKDLFADGDLIYRRIYSNNKFSYGADYRPYGSVVPPDTGQFPQQWDTRPESEGNQPLYYELPITDQAPPYQARMGQVQSKTELKKLFAQTYGVWKYSVDSKKYLPVNADNWSLPTSTCSSSGRPTTASGFYCLVKPKITNFKWQNINASSSGANSGVPIVARLTFNIVIDPDQVPIRMYSVNWGDGSATTSYSGVSLLPRPAGSTVSISDFSKFFTLYHYYNRAELTSNIVKVTITVRDNWNAWVTYERNVNLNKMSTP